MNSRRLLLLAVACGGSALVAGCAAPSGASVAVQVQAPAKPSVVAAQPPQVTVEPVDQARAVPLDTPVTVTSPDGTLTAVAVTRVGGGLLAGALTADQHTWTSSDGLDPAAEYRVVATAAGAGGTHTSTAATFTTMTRVSRRLLSTATPADGEVVGVGEPIDLSFNVAIAPAQQAGIVQRLHVVSTPAQPGAWRWFGPSELHYRPAQYWQPGTKVTVTADFHGVNAGNGAWGLAGWSRTFAVGDKHVSLIDNNTHLMQVYSNDQLINTWPVSLGKPGFETLSGTLVVLYKTPVVKMSSCATFHGAACTPGNANYYDENVYADTAVSTNGYFIHAAPWSVASQGVVNVSHGCVNLSTARATAFYNWSVPGDVVVISNTSNIADINNGEADWQIPFAQWDNTGVVH